jgi:hypothetical protein
MRLCCAVPSQVLTTYWVLSNWGGRTEPMRRPLGSLCVVTATHLAGAFLSIRFATIITHRCQVPPPGVFSAPPSANAHPSVDGCGQPFIAGPRTTTLAL